MERIELKYLGLSICFDDDKFVWDFISQFANQGFQLVDNETKSKRPEACMDYKTGRHYVHVKIAESDKEKFGNFSQKFFKTNSIPFEI